MRSFWRRLAHRFRSLWLMTWREKTLLAESLAMLAAARLFVRATPGNCLVARMGGTGIYSGEPPGSAVAGIEATRVGAMLDRAARITWWRSMCLEKAVAGKWMLRRRGISGTVYVGLARQGQKFVAHAWLVAEGQTVTGAGTRPFAALASFREF